MDTERSGLDEAMDVGSSTVSHLKSLKTAATFSKAGYGAALGGPFTAAIGAVIANRNQLAKILLVILAILLLPVLFIVMLPGLIFGSLTEQSDVLNSNSMISENIRASREAIVEVLEESHEDILAEIHAAISRLPQGDTASINDPYTYSISVNANLLISQFCASQDDYKNINLNQLKKLIRENKEGLFSYDVATETVAYSDMMCARPSWPYDRYGDKEYVEHVLRYYQITASGGSYPANGMQIPHYLQTDYGNIPYGEGSIASSGCGPTSFAMIASYLTGTTITPIDAISWCGNSYYKPGVGTYWSYFQAASDHFGCGTVTQTSDPNQVLQALSEGHPVISSQRAGLFTSGGHFIVLRGVTAGGKVLNTLLSTDSFCSLEELEYAMPHYQKAVYSAVFKEVQDKISSILAQPPLRTPRFSLQEDPLLTVLYNFQRSLSLQQRLFSVPDKKIYQNYRKALLEAYCQKYGAVYLGKFPADGIGKMTYTKYKKTDEYDEYDFCIPYPDTDLLNLVNQWDTTNSAKKIPLYYKIQERVLSQKGLWINWEKQSLRILKK